MIASINKKIPAWDSIVWPFACEVYDLKLSRRLTLIKFFRAIRSAISFIIMVTSNSDDGEKLAPETSIFNELTRLIAREHFFTFAYEPEKSSHELHLIPVIKLVNTHTMGIIGGCAARTTKRSNRRSDHA
jgi:hypothetical protein